jgi:hypothetical protein
MKRLLVMALVTFISACSNPNDTVVPTSIDKMASIQPQLDKLTTVERKLFAGYVVRHTLGVNMGRMVAAKPEPIPEGMTIGKAIEEQRAFSAKAEEKALK